MNNDFVREIGERIREVRKSLKLSQSEMGNKINITKQTILNYEGGRRFPTVDFLLLLIDKLKVNANWLFIGEGKMFRVPSSDSESFDLLLENIKQVFPGLEIDKNVKRIVNALPDDILRNTMANAVIKAIKMDPDLFENIEDTVMVGGARQ